MRVSRVQHAKNRQEVIAAAGKLLLERGIEGIGVDALAKAAGMTHGAVYSHFGSNEDLAAAAIRESLTEFRERWIADAGGDGAPDLFNRLVRSYVSPSHRDNPGMGCALAAMGEPQFRSGGCQRGVLRGRGAIDGETGSRQCLKPRNERWLGYPVVRPCDLAA